MPRYPKTAIPAVRSSLATLKVRRRAIYGLLALSVCAGLFGGCASLTASHPKIPAAEPSSATKAVALAQTVAEDYLEARQTLVPTAPGVPNDFAIQPVGDSQPVKPYKVESLTVSRVTPQQIGDGGRQSIELIRFLAIVDNPTTTPAGTSTSDKPAPYVAYDVTVTMLVSATASPVLGAAPSIAPTYLPPGGPAADYSTYNNALDATSLDAGTRNAATRWANAYAAAGNNSDALRAVTGDQNSADHYSGMGGWTAQVLALGKAIKVSSPLPGYVVRVSLALTPPAANGPTLRNDYDLYIATDGTLAQPPVVAWGPAGSIGQLSPYMNATTS